MGETRVYYKDKEVDKLNYLLEKSITKNDKQSLLKSDLKYVEEDIWFGWYIRKAREDLGLPDEFLDYNEYISNPDIVEEWVADKLSELDGHKHSDDEYRQKFLDVVVRTIEYLHLPYGWIDFIMAYIALDERPTETKVQRDMQMSVVEVNDAYVTITIEKGISAADYKSAWGGLKGYLKQPSAYKLPQDSLKNKIINDKINGHTVALIAKKYMPEQYKDDPQKVTDYIKKIISRHKKKGQK